MERVSNYEAAIETEESRLALNSLTKDRIARARKRNERLRFSSKGVDAFSSTRKYLENRNKYGEHHVKTKAAERVLDYDISTGLFEETEDVFLFSVEYDVVENKIMTGDQFFEDLTANGATDPRVDEWYKQRAFIEAREAVLVSRCLESGTLNDYDIVTISNTSTAQNASDYFNGKDLMVRQITFDKKNKKIKVQTLKMNTVDNEIIDNLYKKLDLKIDNITFQESSDQSIKYLASSIKVKKGELINGAADIGFLLDWVATEKTGKRHLFGRRVESVDGNPYSSISKESLDKETRRKKAIEQLKHDFINMVESSTESLEKQKEKYQDARGRVADIEGRDFVKERYGERAAQQFDAKKKAISGGDFGGAQQAEYSMQKAMGDPVVCGTVMSVNKQTESYSSTHAVIESASCPRLPKPGEKAKCPCCRSYVVVSGTKEKIYCSKKNCKLEDPKLKKKRQAREKVRMNKIKNNNQKLKKRDKIKQ